MSVREYIGARYVPVFADPIQWDPTSVYEPLTVVTNQGASYVSRRMVPEGIQLSNTDYWVLWADFNAQLQHYIDEVDAFDGRIDALEAAMPIADFDTVNTVDARFDDIEAKLPASAFDSTNTVDARFDDIEAKLPASAFDSTNTVNAKFTVIENRLSNLEPKTHMVVIGDSYSRPGDGLSTESDFWYYKLAQKLGLTYHRFAVGGCGFVQGATPFATQIANAAADNSFDNNDVGLLIIFGGVNDCYNNFSIGGYKTIIENALALAKSSFPNARIILAGVNTFATIWSRVGYSTSGITVYHTTKEIEEVFEMAALETFGVMFIPFMRQMVAQTDWFQNSGTGHPNATGQTIIANIFLKALSGLPHWFETYRTVMLSDNGSTQLVGSGQIACTFNSFDMNFYGISIATASYAGGNYMIAGIPFGLDGMMPGGMGEVTCPIGIGGTSTTSKEHMTWAYIEELTAGFTPTASRYVQSELVVAQPSTSSAGMRLGGF